METKINEQESLRLITEMIAQARSNFRKGAGNSVIFWGYVIAVIALINYLLLLFSEMNNLAYLVWNLVIPVFIFDYLHGRKEYKKAIVKTHIDKVAGDVWLAFFISNLFFLGAVYCLHIGLKSFVPLLLITPGIMVMVGLASFVTGKLYRFKPHIYGAVVFWCGALLAAFAPFLTNTQSVQMLILAVSMIAGFVVPGHILNHKAEKDV